MKKTVLLIGIFLLLVGCASSKNKNNTQPMAWQTIPVLKNYDEDLSLKIEQFPDSQVQVMHDVNEEINLNIQKSLGSTLYRITFEKEATQYQDDFYKEEIWIALSPAIENNNELVPALKKASWYFGRFCYCKGLAGYSEILDKKVVLTLDDRIEISFKPMKGETKIEKIQWVMGKK